MLVLRVERSIRNELNSTTSVSRPFPGHAIDPDVARPKVMLAIKVARVLGEDSTGTCRRDGKIRALPTTRVLQDGDADSSLQAYGVTAPESWR